MPNEEQNIAIIDVPMDEFLVFNEVEACNHATLENLDAPDQHPIESIIGLEDRLTKIESLKTVESDKKNSANYYKWSDGISRPFGYFVTFVPNDLTITICDGSDIFGVTIEDAAFVGGQDALVPRDGTYGLVATFGVVDVRCAAGIAVGDYVVSDENGIAVKATENCGYKVFAIKNINTVDYVTISLGVQACTTNLLGTQVKHLDARVGAAEINIADVRRAAADAMEKANSSILNNETTNGNLSDTIDRVDTVEKDVSDLNDKLGTIQKTSDDAKKVADEAKTAADDTVLKLAELTAYSEPITTWESSDGTQKGASYFVEYINDENVKTRADILTLSNESTEHASAIMQNGKSIEMVVTSIDKYGIGEYSAAYGMTFEEANTILRDGMIYIPLDSHEEAYKTQDGEVTREFTCGFYYKWSKDVGWSEKLGDVWVGTIDERPAGTAYDYCYDGDKLYVLSGEEWVEATTIAGNASNRITSMIRQDVNSVAVEVASARGDAASLSARIDKAESQVGMVAKKTDPSTDEGKEHIAAIFATANEDGSNITLSADHIQLSGDAFFVDEKGEATTINGSHITAGSITADQIDTDTLYVDVAHITGEITANHMDAVSGKIGGFDITDGGIAKNGMGLNSNDSNCVSSLVTKGAEYETEVSSSFQADSTGQCVVADHVFTLDGVGTDYVITEMAEPSGTSNLSSTITTNSYSFDGNKISFDMSSSGGFPEPITVTVSFKYMATSNVSPIRFFAGATGETEATATVTFTGKLDKDGNYTGNNVEPLETFPARDIITSVVSCELKQGPGTPHVGMSYLGNYYMVSVSGGEPNEDFVIKTVVKYKAPDPKTSNFIVLDDGSVYAKAANIEGDSNIGGWHIGDNDISAEGVGMHSGDVEHLSLVNSGTGSPIRFYAGAPIDDSVQLIRTKSFSKISGGEVLKRTISISEDEASIYNVGQVQYSPITKEHKGSNTVQSVTVVVNIPNTSYGESTTYNGHTTIDACPSWVPKHSITKLTCTNTNIILRYIGNGQVQASAMSGIQTSFSGDITLEYTFNEELDVDISVDGKDINVEFAPQVADATYSLKIIYALENKKQNFKVLADGSLYASAVNITGTINATDGVFTNVNVESGTIGNLEIANGGLTYNNDNGVSYVLNDAGLTLLRNNATIRAGDLTLGYKVNDKCTTIETAGPLILQGSNGTKLEFMKSATTSDSIKLDIILTGTLAAGVLVEQASYISIHSNTQPLYPVVMDIEWFGPENHGIATLVIPTTSTTSNSVTIAHGGGLFGDGRIRFRYDNSDWFEVNTPTMANTSFQIDNFASFEQTVSPKELVVTGNLIPSINSTQDVTGYTLGSESNRWDTVFARNSVISTSDRNQKNNIQLLSDKHTKIFDSLKPVSYKFNVSNNNRTHIGFIAQDVKESVENAGLTTQDFAAYCEWENDDGSIGCGLRYSEFIAMCVDEIQKLKKRVDDLESKLLKQDEEKEI